MYQYEIVNSVEELAIMQEGEVSAAVLNELKKGDILQVGKKEYLVTSRSEPNKKTFFINKFGRETFYRKGRLVLKQKTSDEELGKPITFDIIEYERGYKMYNSGNAGRNLSRNIEADINVDLINRHNPFHVKSQSYALAEKNIVKINREIVELNKKLRANKNAEILSVLELDGLSDDLREYLETYL